MREGYPLPLGVRSRAENGPKIFGPAQPVVLRARPGPFALRQSPARPVPARRFAARPVPAQKISGTFPTMFAHRFLLYFFYRNICFSGYFYCIIYVFMVLSMFRVTFWKFSSLDRGKGNTRHRLRHTTRPTGNKPGRAGPGLNLGARPGPGPARQENWNFQARSGPARGPPGPFSALVRSWAGMIGGILRFWGGEIPP
jgi:hypothetical protein